MTSTSGIDLWERSTRSTVSRRQRRICAEHFKCSAYSPTQLRERAGLSLEEVGRRAGMAAGRSQRVRAESAYACHAYGMPRTRLSTTVDADLLDGAKRVRSGVTNAALIDAALQALLVRHRAAEVDASCAAYEEHPLDEPDEWGDLASFREVAAAS